MRGIVCSLAIGSFLSLGVAAAAPVSALQEAYFLPDPEGRVVAAAIRFPAGSEQDPIGMEGRAFLFGRIVEEAAAGSLLAYGARVQVEVSPREFLVTFLAPPERWREAYLDLEFALFTRIPSETEIDAARAEIGQVLTFESGSPVRSFERERSALLYGPLHPAARPVRGAVSTLLGLGAPELIAFRTEHLRRERAVVAITGPLDRPTVEAGLRVDVVPLALRRSTGVLAPASPPGGADPLDPPLPGVGGAPGGPEGMPVDLGVPTASRSPLRVPAVPAGPPAWDSSDRTVLDRALTSTWLAVAFPFPAGTSAFLLDFLAHLVTEGLNRTPPDPGLYEAHVAIDRVGDAPVIVISASVDPFRGTEWEDRLRGAFDTLSRTPPQGAFFELTRRRFRSAVFLDLAAPESVVHWIARHVAVERRPPENPEIDVWRLDRDAVAEAARAAGPPRTLVFGPQGLTGP